MFCQSCFSIANIAGDPTVHSFVKARTSQERIWRCRSKRHWKTNIDSFWKTNMVGKTNVAEKSQVEKKTRSHLDSFRLSPRCLAVEAAPGHDKQQMGTAKSWDFMALDSTGLATLTGCLKSSPDADRCHLWTGAMVICYEGIADLFSKFGWMMMNDDGSQCDYPKLYQPLTMAELRASRWAVAEVDLHGYHILGARCSALQRNQLEVSCNGDDFLYVREHQIHLRRQKMDGLLLAMMNTTR